tara:strand:- start:591 stop:968 length:378 start_codon:yes stop_codon:yes gene_type:complete
MIDRKPRGKMRKKNKPKSDGFFKDSPKNNRKIPMELVNKFVGHVENLEKIDITNITNTNSFRIDVWISYFFFEHQVYPSYKIGKSWFVKYDEESGKIIDKTLGIIKDTDNYIKGKKKLPSLNKDI